MKVFANSLPKSGTNMLQKFLGMAQIEYSKRSIGASSIFARYEMIRRFLRSPRFGEVPVEVGLEVPIVASPTWLSQYLRHAKGYVSGHAPYSDHLFKLLQDSNFKVIQMVRHPGAVLVSWAKYIAEPGYYWKAASEYLGKMPFEKRLEFMLYGGMISKRMYYASFQMVLNRTERWLCAKNVLVVRFEDLVGRKGGGSDDLQRKTIIRILDFLGQKYTAADVDRIQDNLFGGTPTFRNGRVSAWREAAGSEQIEKMALELGNSTYLSRLGYSFEESTNF